ncbi:tripartite tricarboxylate transporter permease [Nonomuraea sp. B12E4]|uniref:tripartite tricarboxylate transporter permease n=1 Tax=Nonomuraea sp. B12E4 TaxID=3153564 RepID=UPI00325EC7ED
MTGSKRGAAPVREILIGAGALVLAVAALGSSWGIESAVRSHDIGPAAWPIVLTGCMGVLALTVSAVGSLVGGLAGIILFMVAATPLASVALRFGPAEMFALAVFGLTMMVSVAEGATGQGPVRRAGRPAPRRRRARPDHR